MGWPQKPARPRSRWAAGMATGPARGAERGVGLALGAGRTIVLGAGAETALAGTAVPATDSFVASFEIGVLVRGSVELDPGVVLGVAPEVESPAESAGLP